MPDHPLHVRCRENGPLIVPASIAILDHLGNPFPVTAGKDFIALCRCGQSKSRPFCDGSHKGCGFLAGETAPAGAAG